MHAGQPRPGGKCHPLAEAEEVHQAAELGETYATLRVYLYGTRRRNGEVPVLKLFRKRAFTEHREVLGNVPESLCQYRGGQVELGAYFNSTTLHGPIRLLAAGLRPLCSIMTRRPRMKRQLHGVENTPSVGIIGRERRDSYLIPPQFCPTGPPQTPPQATPRDFRSLKSTPGRADS